MWTTMNNIRHAYQGSWMIAGGHLARIYQGFHNHINQVAGVEIEVVTGDCICQVLQ